MNDTQLSRLLELLSKKHPHMDALFQLHKGLQSLMNSSDVEKIDFSFLFPFPPGHYYSPLPSREEVARVAPRVWGSSPKSLPGIDLNTRGQQRLFAKFAKHYKELPYSEGTRGALRYHFDNDFFGHGDAIFLYCMLREFSPRRFVEVGSGYSSCVALDAMLLGLDMNCTFIEPYPQRLHSLLRPEDKSRVAILENNVQDVPMDVFMTLDANDILFIDSSHVGKIGSDVLHVLFEILPRLKEGVIVHFHDIFYPFEYPRNWVEDAYRAWNEDYFMRAFLQNNASWSILFFNSYMATFFPEMLEKWTPLVMKNTGGSLWLVKTAA